MVVQSSLRLCLRRCGFLLFMFGFAGACQPAPTPTATPSPTQAIPTARPVVVLCADVDSAWGRADWPSVIDALEQVAKVSGTCGGQDPALKLYPAWYNYGAALDTRGQRDEAINAYRQALLYNPTGVEAATALSKRAALTPLPLESCPTDQVQAAISALQPYQPTGANGFVRLANNQFQIEGQPFAVRGINYYPARAPWRRFLNEADPATMENELDLLQSAGLNTLRIFLWYDGLFDCPGNGIVPNIAAFGRVEALFRLAAARGLRLIVTLNDLPDLTIRPLYTQPERPAQLTRFIVGRYKDEAAILAWDLRNEGDIDYIRGLANGRAVIDWLKATSTIVRAVDPNHLITAGWNDDAGSTRNAVDFISFHHWTQPGLLVDRVRAIREVTDKPILLQEVGYSARATGEAQQAELLAATLKAAKAQNLLGWMIWTAFDFTPDVTCTPPACPGLDNAEHHFGLWRTGYVPKPALSAVQSAP